MDGSAPSFGPFIPEIVGMVLLLAGLIALVRKLAGSHHIPSAPASQNNSGRWPAFILIVMAGIVVVIIFIGFLWALFGPIGGQWP